MSRKDYELIAAALHRSRMAKELIANAKERGAALSGVLFGGNRPCRYAGP